jgi:antitoxin (DNA-binding transcriptional repressor) of toxin-antitoxin stability system
MEAMSIYDLPYAQEHLAELFQEARTGEDVIIVRSDGRRCQLLPVADVKEEAPAAEKSTSFDLGAGAEPVPA